MSSPPVFAYRLLGSLLMYSSLGSAALASTAIQCDLELRPTLPYPQKGVVLSSDS